MGGTGQESCGSLYGVGVGPGDPELLTLKAKRILQSVQLVCVPQAETSSASYALDIVRQFLDLEKLEIMKVRFPTNDPEAAGKAWRCAAESLADRMKRGQDVAFITEGDPMLFGTFPMCSKS